MTTNEEQEQDELIETMEPLMAGILTAQIREYQSANDAVLEAKDQEIAELRTALVSLWYDVNRANDMVDSYKIEILLAKYGTRVAHAEDALIDPRS